MIAVVEDRFEVPLGHGRVVLAERRTVPVQDPLHVPLTRRVAETSSVEAGRFEPPSILRLVADHHRVAQSIVRRLE